MKIRDAKQSDLGYIMKSWVRTAPKGRGKNEPRPDDKHELQKMIAAIAMGAINGQRSRTLIACPSSDENHIHGFAVGTPCGRKDGGLLLHYAYVRKSDRGQGIARKLIWSLQGESDARTVTATHITPELMPRLLSPDQWGELNPDKWRPKTAWDYAPRLLHEIYIMELRRKIAA